MNAVEKFNKTLGAMEYNDREEALYSIFKKKLRQSKDLGITRTVIRGDS